jgi:hypothetical protein
MISSFLMSEFEKHIDALRVDGFTVIEAGYTRDEVSSIAAAIDDAEHSNTSFRKTKDLFAIRRVLQEIPSLFPLIFNRKLTDILASFGSGHFIVKSIYFDKPEESNWFVAWHQDLTISVDKKVELAGFSLWTKKFDRYAVQPPVNILENGITIRIHLDDTDEQNGALKVIAGSHNSKITRVETVNLGSEKFEVCCVPAGGVMLMRPLLMHASDRSVSSNRRRVIHLEFNSIELPAGLEWAER